MLFQILYPLAIKKEQEEGILMLFEEQQLVWWQTESDRISVTRSEFHSFMRVRKHFLYSVAICQGNGWSPWSSEASCHRVHVRLGKWRVGLTLRSCHKWAG